MIDSSALIAIIKGEEDADQFRTAIAAASRAMLGAPNKLEVMMVAGGRYGPAGKRIAQALIDYSAIEVADCTEQLADLAVDAFMKFGRGRHPAKLNFGDCMSYALAKSLGAPLLYKGNDFAKTDIESAAPA